MKLHKIALAACIASTMAMVAAPAQAAAYFIGGKWYYFSLDFEASLAKITGNDLKTGTNVFAEAKITSADTQCLNPSENLVPGVGPNKTVSGKSPNVTSNDLTKSDNRVQGNIYATTTTLNTDDPATSTITYCKSVPGQGDWTQVYWRNQQCNKGDITGFTSTCYQDLAVKGANDVLFYIVADSSNKYTLGSAVGDDVNWASVYLPKAFKFKAVLQNTAKGTYDTIYGSCQFPVNTENSKGLPYSIDNPPAAGWAANPGVAYTCVGITAAEY